jgi:hypothetical protein
MNYSYWCAWLRFLQLPFTYPLMHDASMDQCPTHVGAPEDVCCKGVAGNVPSHVYICTVRSLNFVLALEAFSVCSAKL